MNRWKEVFFTIIYALFILSFSIYTFSQIDLNLTLSSNTVYQYFQKNLIFLGYYNRQFSVFIFIFLLSVFFALYLFLLKKTVQNKAKIIKMIIVLLGLNVLFGLISYPAFSHDFFNYIFDARILTLHHMNPYLYRALDFPDDLWVRFMHWTHRTYPYGPLWLIATLPFSFFGFGKFVLTMLLFKIMFISFYLLNIYLVSKIAENLNKKNQLNAVISFAFNPLIIIETLISPHNESLMLTLLLVSFYFLFVKKNLLNSYFWLASSSAVKFATSILLPLYLIKKLAKNSDKFLKLSLILLFIPIFFQIQLREAYPWYFIPVVGISVLIDSILVKSLIIALSFGALLRYTPFLITGSYPEEAYGLMNIFLITPVIIVLAYTFLRYKIYGIKS